MATAITSTITHHVTYNSTANNPLSITGGGAILASDGFPALTLGSGIEWTVTNNGTVANTAAGTLSGGGIYATLATITNTGLIAASLLYGVNLIGNSVLADSVVINSGTITDSFSSALKDRYGAVNLASAGEVTNQAGGLISGVNNGIVGYRGAVGSFQVQVTNQGRVDGGTYGVDTAGKLTLSNSGTISGGIAGLVAAGYGTLTSTGASIVTNEAGGLIEGARFGVTFGGNANTLFNAGTISGSSAAVIFAPDYNTRLVDIPGAVFIGAVNGGNPGNALGSATISTLELASGSSTGTLSGLGVSTGFTNFTAITLDAGASWVFSNTNTVGAYSTLINSGLLTIGAGAVLFDPGHLTLASSVEGPGTIAFPGSGVTLTVDRGVTVAPTITGFNTNTLALVGMDETISGFGNGQLTLGGAAAITLNVAGTYNQSNFNASYDTVNHVTMLTACFAEGSRILTDRGPVAVEALVVGDRVVTASGRLAAVRWLGHRRTNLRQHPSPHDVMPVRVAAGAFGGAQPVRDLVLSPDHAVFVNGSLVPIRHLINGASIRQETREAVTYWHVELDRHDVLLAEGLACESYLDTGNRAAFENALGATELHPDFARRVWAEDGCAPILTDPAEPELRALHVRLLAQASSASRPVAAAG